MKKIILFIFLIQLPVLAFDNQGDLFNDRMQWRFQNRDINEFNHLEENTIPQNIEVLRTDALNNLLAFADAYNLFDLGWSYQSNTIVYEVTDSNNKVIGYNFSIDIYKGDIKKSRRFYQASLRVDGEFFVERIANYDL